MSLKKKEERKKNIKEEEEEEKKKKRKTKKRHNKTVGVCPLSLVHFFGNDRFVSAAAVARWV